MEIWQPAFTVIGEIAGSDHELSSGGTHDWADEA